MTLSNQTGSFTRTEITTDLRTEVHDVLVIDDEYGARLQVELALMTSDSLRVVGEAANGMRGAELAEQVQPDIIVLDLAMPVMDGFEALPLLRSLAPSAVVVVRTGSDDEDSTSRALELGAVDVIPKFLAPDELRARLEGHRREVPPLLLSVTGGQPHANTVSRRPIRAGRPAGTRARDTSPRAY